MSHATAIRTILFGLPAKTKLADAEMVLEAARSAVEAHRSINRTLPERVPLAALDALVKMELLPGGTYTLFLEVNGVKARMDSSGIMTVEHK